MSAGRLKTYHPVLHEIRDHAGNWVTGWRTFTGLADLIGTTTADLMRRLAALDVVEMRDGRNRLTTIARQKGYGTTRRGVAGDAKTRVETDVLLPDGMVLVVKNLDATNLPMTETEKLIRTGLSQRDVATRLGISQQAVQKRLRAIPPRLKDWPVLGSWDDRDEADNDNTDNPSACAA